MSPVRPARAGGGLRSKWAPRARLRSKLRLCCAQAPPSAYTLASGARKWRGRDSLEKNRRVLTTLSQMIRPPITNVPLAEKACDQRFADAYNDLNGIVFSATTMLLVGDSSFG